MTMAKAKRLVAIFVAVIIALGLSAPQAFAYDYDYTVEAEAWAVTYNEDGSVATATIVISITNNTTDNLEDAWVGIPYSGNGWNVYADDGIYLNDTKLTAAANASRLKSTAYSYLIVSNQVRVNPGTLNAGSTVYIEYTITLSSNISSYSPGNISLYLFSVTTGMPIWTSPSITSIPLKHAVREAGEKTSVNLTSDGGEFFVGDTVRYSITASNTSAAVSSLWEGVTVTDTLPAAAALVSGSVKIDGNAAASGQYTYDEQSGELVVSLGDIGPESACTVTFEATITGSVDETIKNTATISGADNGRQAGEASVEVSDEGFTVKSAPVYTVTYKANGGSGSDITETYRGGASVTVADNTFTHSSSYDFSGWNTKSDGTGDSYKAGDKFVIAEDITLYAQWQDNSGGLTTATTYTVTYKANGGSGSDITETYNGGVSVTVLANTFTRSGYNFSGWNTANDGTGTGYTAGNKFTMPLNNVILYAQWSRIIDNSGNSEHNDPTPSTPNTTEELPGPTPGPTPDPEPVPEPTPDPSPSVPLDTDRPETTPGRTLEPAEDGGFIELDENGTPLGHWTQDGDGIWIYEPYVSLGKLPQTGPFGVINAALFAIFALALLALVVTLQIKPAKSRNK